MNEEFYVNNPIENFYIDGSHLTTVDLSKGGTTSPAVSSVANSVTCTPSATAIKAEFMCEDVSSPCAVAYDTLYETAHHGFYTDMDTSLECDNNGYFTNWDGLIVCDENHPFRKIAERIRKLNTEATDAFYEYKDLKVSEFEKDNFMKKSLSTFCGKLWGEYFHDGKNYTYRYIMPTVLDVREVVKGKVVIVDFEDGTSEKAILSGEDVFSLEQGISICITKRLLSGIMGEGKGSSFYNKIIEHALKVKSDNEKAEEEEKVTAERIAKKKEKIAKRKKARRERREKAEAEKQINIQKEAILRAMREMQSESCDRAVDEE